MKETIKKLLSEYFVDVNVLDDMAIEAIAEFVKNEYGVDDNTDLSFFEERTKIEISRFMMLLDFMRIEYNMILS